MSKYAICIGINDYPGTNSDLHGCVNDAYDWCAALESCGFQCDLMIDNQATGDNIRSAIDQLARSVSSDDVVVITFSGHGSFVPDEDGDEKDGFDECWCPYDIVENGPIIDDELHQLFSQRPKGCRWTVISDSCHSGTMTRFSPISTPPTTRLASAPQRLVRFMAPDEFMNIPKRFTKEKAHQVYTASRPGRRNNLLLSGCQDTEYSYDAWFEGRPNGAFTFVALRELQSLERTATYEDWYDRIRSILPSMQYPQAPNIDGTKSMKKWVVFASSDEDEIPITRVSPAFASKLNFDASIDLGRTLARNAVTRRRSVAPAAQKGRRTPIVAEGDSWFRLPLKSDVVDCLEGEHNFDVRSVAYHGHTIQEMATEHQFEEVVREIDKLIEDDNPPQAVLLSGGGNDVTGQTLDNLLNHALSSSPGLKPALLDAVINDVIIPSYTTIISGVTEIMLDRMKTKAPIITHGYAFAVPDGRGYEFLGWKFAGPWLRPSFIRKGYSETQEMQPIVDELINRLNETLLLVARQPGFEHVRHVDLRRAIDNGQDHRRVWGDELHLKSRAYKSVARLFADAIRN